MNVFISFAELHAYIEGHFNQNVSFSKAGEKELGVTYTKRVFIKDVNVSIDLKFIEVKKDSLLIGYSGGFGLDMVIAGALKFATAKFPELSAGITPMDDHKIAVDLTKIKKAKALTDNIDLVGIDIEEEGIKATVSLKIA